MGFIEFYTIFPDFVHYSRVSVLADFVIYVLERLELLFETLLGLQRKLNKKTSIPQRGGCGQIVPSLIKDRRQKRK